MKDTTTNGPGESPSHGFASNVRHVAGDVADLVQLQVELFEIDAQKSVRLLLVPIVLLIAGSVVLATSALLAFTALALWLHVAQDVRLGAAFLVSALAAILFGALCFGGGALFVKWRGVPLTRSWREMKRNLAWVRRSVVGRGIRS